MYVLRKVTYCSYELFMYQTNSTSSWAASAPKSASQDSANGLKAQWLLSAVNSAQE